MVGRVSTLHSLANNFSFQYLDAVGSEDVVDPSPNAYAGEAVERGPARAHLLKRILQVTSEELHRGARWLAVEVSHQDAGHFLLNEGGNSLPNQLSS